MFHLFALFKSKSYHLSISCLDSLKTSCACYLSSSFLHFFIDCKLNSSNNRRYSCTIICHIYIYIYIFISIYFDQRIHIKSLSFQQTIGCLDSSCAFSNMCYRSSSHPQILVVNNSSMHEQLAILIYIYIYIYIYI